MNGFHCPECGAICQEGERFCTRCGAGLASLTRCAGYGYPVGAYASASGTLAVKRTNLGLSIYNKLMLLLILWPSLVFWTDIFTIETSVKSLSFGFLDFSNLSEQLAVVSRAFRSEEYEALFTILSAVKYLFIAAAVVAAARYIKGWMDSDNGRPVQVWQIVGCYVTPVVTFIVAAYLFLLICQENEVTHAVATALEVTLWPSRHYVLAMAVPPVIGCFARPFFIRT